MGNTVTIPEEEYNLLKELYTAVKRQNFILRIDEAEKNLKKGLVKKVKTEKFLRDI